jgi:hypothetical protein
MGLSLKQSFLTIMALPIMATAQSNECYLQDRSISRSTAVIAERSPVRKEVFNHIGNERRCVVDFKVRINTEWHTAYGSYIWDGAVPESQACARAVANAENEILQRVGNTNAVNERILVCNDRRDLVNIRSPEIGQTGNIGQFRPHPDKLERFYYNGTQCKWFVESSFVQNRMRQYQGIICETQNGVWVVVDKF